MNLSIRCEDQKMHAKKVPYRCCGMFAREERLQKKNITTPNCKLKDARLGRLISQSCSALSAVLHAPIINSIVTLVRVPVC
jgi:hypothetical protein